MVDSLAHYRCVRLNPLQQEIISLLALSSDIYSYVIYNHQIFCTISSEEAIAIKLALKAGKIFDDDPYYFKVKHDGGSSEKPVTQFIGNNFQQIQRYMCCFWDVG
ncbi:hypothetical protein [Nostoc sp.]|uniref:hypothetical protein n=1 Tax=Nostoc sp. TaxID=1180 RepID=UPI002FF59A52